MIPLRRSWLAAAVAAVLCGVGPVAAPPAAAAEPTYGSVAAAFDSEAISSDSAPAGADFDGEGNSFSATDLARAGWAPGARITINGGTFTWSATAPGRPDNVTADGQRIAVHGTGTAVQFLAAASGGAFSGSGTVTYTDGSASPYTLTVDDWSAGRADTSAVTLPHRNTAAGTRPGPVLVYAVAVPARAGRSITSITLPRREPGAELHVFDLTVRDTTSAPRGASWTGSWSAPISSTRVGGQAPNWRRQTLRMVVHPNTGGPTARIRLANTFAPVPVTIDHGTMASQAAGATAASAPVSLTFGGRRQVTIPAGAEVYSDPAAFQVTGGKNLLVSLHLPGPVTAAPVHPYALSDSYLSSTDGGDHAADAGGAAFPTTVSYWAFLTGVDVTAPGSAGTIVALGDSQTDGAHSTHNQNRRWPDEYGKILRSRTPTYGILNAGVNANRLIAESQGGSGVPAPHRLDRDVLAQPNVRTLVLYEGINDIAIGDGAAADVIAATRRVAAEARAFGLRVVVATIPAFGRSPRYTEGRENVRQQVNAYLRTTRDVDAYLDFDQATRDPDRPSVLAAAYASSDGLHFTDAGTRKLATIAAADAPAAPLLFSQTAVGDLNRDGLADLVARDDATGQLKRWLCQDGGTMAAPAAVTGGWRPFSQTVMGDVNRDGVADLMAREDASGKLKRWLGRGDGTFGAPVDLTGGWQVFSQTVAGDINRDGVADLMAREDASGQLKRWLGHGDGTFEGPQPIVPAW